MYITATPVLVNYKKTKGNLRTQQFKKKQRGSSNPYQFYSELASFHLCQCPGFTHVSGHFIDPCNALFSTPFLLHPAFWGTYFLFPSSFAHYILSAATLYIFSAHIFFSFGICTPLVFCFTLWPFPVMYFFSTLGCKDEQWKPQLLVKCKPC